jgi:hypothetical protein
VVGDTSSCDHHFEIGHLRLAMVAGCDKTRKKKNGEREQDSIQEVVVVDERVTWCCWAAAA